MPTTKKPPDLANLGSDLQQTELTLHNGRRPTDRQQWELSLNAPAMAAAG